MIGVGGSDTLGQAESFAATYGGPPHTLWSDSYTAWNHYNAGNPIVMLLDATGATVIERQSGFRPGPIEEALASLA